MQWHLWIQTTAFLFLLITSDSLLLIGFSCPSWAPVVEQRSERDAWSVMMLVMKSSYVNLVPLVIANFNLFNVTSELPSYALYERGHFEHQSHLDIQRCSKRFKDPGKELTFPPVPPR